MTSSVQPQQRVTFTQALLDLGAPKAHIRYIKERVDQTGEEVPKAAIDMGLISPETIAKALAKISNSDYFSPYAADKINKAEIMRFINSIDEGNQIDMSSYAGYVPVQVIKDDAGNFKHLLFAVSSVSQLTSVNQDYYEYLPKHVIASPQTIQKIYRTHFVDTKKQFFDALEKIKVDSDNENDLQEFYCALLKHACYYGANDIKMWRSKEAGMISFKKEGRGELLTSMRIDTYSKITEFLKTSSSNSHKLKAEPLESSIDDTTFTSTDVKERYSDIFSRYVFRVQLYLKPDNGWLSTVIRVNDSQSQVTDFSGLDFADNAKNTLRNWVNSPTGLILVTGPTGSGKTSVLYSMLREIDPIERSVSTVENPIEYSNGMWNQKLMAKSQDRSESDMAKLMLNSLLREAPDVILFGEVRRDKQLLENVIDASNTGHLVFSTMHTQNATSTILRLLDIGADPKTVASSLMGVLSVRLLGVLCPHCKKEEDNQFNLNTIKQHKHYKEGDKIYKSVGCPICSNKGYMGRKMVYEILNCGKIKSQIESGAKSFSSMEQAGLLDNETMWDRGMYEVVNGHTSFDEIQRRVFNPALNK